MTWRGTARIKALSRPFALDYRRSLPGQPVLSAPKAYILHLERAISRAANVQALKGRLPIACEIFAAVDGARLSPEEIDRAYARRRFRPRYPFSLTASEVGVFLSHRAI